MNIDCIAIAEAARLEPGKIQGDEHFFRCPRHDDQEPSLRVNLKKKGFSCKPCNAEGNYWKFAAFLAGVDPEDKSAVAGWLRERGLLNGNNGTEHRERQIAAVYGYRTLDGELSYEVIRFEPKDFRQRRPDGNGGFAWDTKGLKRLPYRLPELGRADYIFVAEGEKDVDAICGLGLSATCNTGGAGKWTAELSQYFRADQYVTVLPDNDTPGRDHARQVAEALYGKVASLKMLELAGLPDKGDVSDWLKGRDQEGAAEELCRLAEAAPEWKPAETELQERPTTAGWKLYDAADAWPQDPLVWDVEGLIPKRGIGFMSAPPKDRKSLLTLDLALHLAQREARRWFEKFLVTPAKVLYIAREDPLRRIDERKIEICNSYGMPLPAPGRLQFLVRERINLTNPEHLAWLKNAIRAGGFEFLIFDVINRMHPDLDEISAKDMGLLMGILEELNRDLGVTILSDDHTRKPQGRNTARDAQEPNPFDMKGSMAKYGCADFMICLSRTSQSNRMQVYCENKDTDERPHFFLDVSPKGSTDPKFTYAGSIERAANDMKMVGENNREKVCEALAAAGDWISPKDVSRRLSISGSTTNKHLSALLEAGRIEQRGKSRNIQYRAIFNRSENTPRGNTENLFDDND